jgi:hypothetical protein
LGREDIQRQGGLVSFVIIQKVLRLSDLRLRRALRVLRLVDLHSPASAAPSWVIETWSDPSVAIVQH